MSMKNAKCQVADCQRLASDYCFCCQNNICTSHMLEHIENMKVKMNSLADQVDRTMERVQNLTVEQLSRPGFNALNQWRMEMHELIDDIHRSKSEDIEEILNKNKWKFDEHTRQQSEGTMKLQEGVKQLVDDDDVTFEQIESFQNQLRQIETNSIAFEKNFLLIGMRVLPDGLVIVASRVNAPPEPISSRNVKQPPMLGKFRNR